MTTQLKVGDIVRVQRDHYHGVKFGALMRVYDDCDVVMSGQVLVRPVRKQVYQERVNSGPIRTGGDWAMSGQWVDVEHCKYAKQANRREQLA